MKVTFTPVAPLSTYISHSDGNLDKFREQMAGTSWHEVHILDGDINGYVIYVKSDKTYCLMNNQGGFTKLTGQQLFRYLDTHSAAVMRRVTRLSGTVRTETPILTVRDLGANKMFQKPDDGDGIFVTIDDGDSSPNRACIHTGTMSIQFVLKTQRVRLIEPTSMHIQFDRK
ncbi:hypothetical protein VPHK469_0133 [Vibrio phage K469]